MSGFNLAELLPFYLDETDEHIAGLNDALLRLEQDPTDAKALQEAFRMFHSIKGSSVVMGFKPVNQLTHHMESLFEQFRSKKRVLDRPALDLTFRCLDELRDYHRDLRSQGQSEVDLSGLTALVEAALHTTAAATGTSAAAAPQPAPRPEVAEVAAARPAPASLFEEPSGIALTVVFEADLPLADMKARLVLNRLSSRVRVLRTDPPVERLDDVESLSRFTVFLVADCDMDELRALADVEGVAQVRIKSIPQAGLESEPSIPPAAAGLTRTSGAIPASPAVAPTAQAPRDEPQPPAEAMTATASPAPDPTPPEVSEAAEAETGVEAAAAATSATPTPGGPKTGGPKKARIAETIRVESDRLDHLMNLAGELVITKARFVAISRGLEELFRGSNAHSLASDTRERLDSVTRGLETLAADQGRLRVGDFRRLARPMVGPRPSAPRELPRDPGRAGADPRGARADQGAGRGDPQPGPRLRRLAEGRARHADGADRAALRAVPPGHPRPEPLLGQGGAPPDRRREDRAGQADDRRALGPADPHGPQRRRPRARVARPSARRRASRAPAPSRSWPRTAATAW